MTKEHITIQQRFESACTHVQADQSLLYGVHVYNGRVKIMKNPLRIWKFRIGHVEIKYGIETKFFFFYTIQSFLTFTKSRYYSVLLR